MLKKPELLAPAGTLKALKYAFIYGADAVYAGLPRYGLRVRNNEFNMEILAEGINIAHNANKKFFLTLNLIPHNNKLKTFIKDIEPVIALKPDALIMADPGLISMIKDKWSDIPIHLSVQANTINYASVKFWQKQGISRVILSRELSLEEIKEIRDVCTNIELEVFIHGALCIAHSGRCLLSGYFTNRDSNQGACTNACRWQYNVIPAKETPEGIVPLTKKHDTWLLEEKERPGEYMPIYEDDKGTYLMNSRDLCAIEHVEELVKIGVDSLKIEGRTKSYYYAARTSNIYRQAIDNAYLGKPFDNNLITELKGLSHRGYTDGFFKKHNNSEYQNYAGSDSHSGKQRLVGEIASHDTKTGIAVITVKNRFDVGDKIQVVHPSNGFEFILEEMENLEGKTVTEAPGTSYTVCINLGKKDLTNAFLVKYL